MWDVFTYEFASSGGRTRKYHLFIHTYIRSVIAWGRAVIVFLFLWSQDSFENLHTFICRLLQLRSLLLLQLFYLLISFSPSICGWCAHHGSLTVTIWIWSSYRSISVPRVSLLFLVTLATCIIIISPLLFISPSLLYSWHDPHYCHRTFDKQFLCLSVCLCLLRTPSPPVFCQMTAALCCWTTPPASGRLRRTQRRRGGVP